MKGSKTYGKIDNYSSWGHPGSKKTRKYSKIDGYSIRTNPKEFTLFKSGITGASVRDEYN